MSRKRLILAPLGLLAAAGGVTWWWVKGSAFAAFVLALCLIVLVGAGGWFEPYPYDPDAPTRLAWEGIGATFLHRPGFGLADPRLLALSLGGF